LALTPGSVAIAPDGSATGTGLSIVLYESLEDEFDADPSHTVGGVPGAQEALAKMARALGVPIANEVNAHVIGAGAPGATGATGATGDPGPTGATGAQGATGGTGADGATGNTGATGAAGADGATGSTGPQGTAGLDGEKGERGEDGLAGATGATGATGAAGAQGADGRDGVDGEQGLQGATGATGPQGLQGYSGNDGNDGRDGEQGPQGITGATGAPGATGAAGADGADGRDGEQGLQGPTGATGADGAQGLPGADGRDGVDGADGMQGIPGPAPIIAAGQMLGNPLTASSSAPAAALTPAQVDAIVGSVGLTLAHQLVLGTQQNESAFTLGALNVTLAENVTRLYVLINGDGELQTITPVGGATTAGRVIWVYIVGSGTKTVKHAFAGGGIGRIQNPSNVDFKLGNRQSFLAVGDGANGWLVAEPGAIQNLNLADMGPRTVKGKQTDAVTGVPVDLTGAELCENIRRDTIQTLSGVSGVLDVLLNDDTTVLLVRTTADATLRTMSAGTGGGREIMIEHDRLSGTGNLTVAHNTVGTYFPFFLPSTTSIVLGQTECLSVRDRSTFWRSNDPGIIGNIRLASMAAGTVKGNPITAVGAAAPSDLTGAQIGELARFAAVETFTLTAGVQTLTLAKATTWVFIHATGDVIFDAIVHGSSNTGASFVLVRDTGTGRVLLRDGNVGTNSLWMPGSTDAILSSVNDAFEVKHNGFRWYVTDRLIRPAEVTNAMRANMADSTISGRASGAGAGPPTDLSGVQVGAILRRENFIVDSTSTGTIPLYAIAAATTHVNFKLATTIRIQGMTASAATFGKRVTFQCDRGFPGIVEFEDESASTASALERIRCPGTDIFRIREGEQVSFDFWDSRWRLVDFSKRIEPSNLAPVFSALAVPFVMPIVLTPGTPGTPDDVTIYSANAPFAFEVIRIDGRVTAAIAASTLEGRSAAAGGGSSLTDTLSGAALGLAAITAPLGSIATVAAGGSFFIRRSDRGVGGKAYIHAIRT
jgi:hypothetical protein